MDAETIAATWDHLRPDLLGYLTRLVIRPEIAEELAQDAALRALGAVAQAPARADELRPWFFRISTNLAIDFLRRRGTVREDFLPVARETAEAMPEFVEHAGRLQGSPEMLAIAREHLVVCFSCTLGQLAPQQAAALLLREVYGFTGEEIAAILDARFGQAKSWLQEARATMQEAYGRTCSLLGKQGVCYQCVELDEYFGAGRGDPLAGTDGSLDARLALLREQATRLPGSWHRLLFSIFNELG
jgi:RNA polymerase sigma-70 factor (ECF subfamily)